MNLKKSLNLGYAYIFFFNLSFWYGPWLIFYLRFVDYGQVGIIQAVSLLATVLFEIPTGAITDLIGKRMSLLLGAVLIAIGEIIIPFVPSFGIFLLTSILIRIGMSFFSGTMDAYMYDTLASDNKTDDYPKVISKMSFYETVATCLASVIGGYLFLVNSGFPWYLTSLAKLICFVTALRMIEPRIDTVKVSIKTAMTQLSAGFKQLFSAKLLWFSVFILTLGVFSKFLYEILDDTNVIEFGLHADQIGSFFAFIIFLGIPVSLFYDKIQRRIKPIYLLISSSVLYTIILILTPFVSIYGYIILFTFRRLLSPIRGYVTSQIVNKHTPSNIRATTLSTIELIASIPFVLLSFPIGHLMSQYTSKVVTGGLGVLLLIAIIIQIPNVIKWSKEL